MIAYRDTKPDWSEPEYVQPQLSQDLRDAAIHRRKMNHIYGWFISLLVLGIAAIAWWCGWGQLK